MQILTIMDEVELIGIKSVKIMIGLCFVLTLKMCYFHLNRKTY